MALVPLGRLPRPFGLPNMGSTCYWNSYMQMLLSCSSFCDLFVEAGESGAPVPPLWRAFADMIRLSRSPAASDVDFNMATTKLFGEFVRSLRERRPKTPFGHGQESAEEGLTLFIDMLDETREGSPSSGSGSLLPGSPGLPLPSRPFLHRYRNWTRCGLCGKTNGIQAADHSIVFDWFGLPPAATAAEFSNAVLRGSSRIDADHYCEKCGGRGPAERFYQLTMIPEVFIVRFNLYGEQYGGAAPSDRGQFPLSFTLEGKAADTAAADTAAAATAKPPRMRWHAVAQVIHNGSLHGGHYYAVANRLDNDDVVRDFTLNDSGVFQGRLGPRGDTYLVAYHYVGTD